MACRILGGQFFQGLRVLMIQSCTDLGGVDGQPEKRGLPQATRTLLHVCSQDPRLVQVGVLGRQPHQLRPEGHGHQRVWGGTMAGDHPALRAEPGERDPHIQVSPQHSCCPHPGGWS